MRVKSPRWTTERFKLASRAGCFHDMKVELVGGRLVEMTESPEHRNTVENLVELFAAVFDKDHWVSSEQRRPWHHAAASGDIPVPFLRASHSSQE